MVCPGVGGGRFVLTAYPQGVLIFGVGGWQLKVAIFKHESEVLHLSRMTKRLC